MRRMAAKEDVMTTLLTVGALFLIAFKMPTVPLTAKFRLIRCVLSCMVTCFYIPGSSKSFFTSVTLKLERVSAASEAANV